MRSTINLLTLAQAAIGFTKAVADTAHCKDALKGGYYAWRVENRNFDDIERRSPEWDSMMWSCPHPTDRYWFDFQAFSGAGVSTGGVASATQTPPVGNPVLGAQSHPALYCSS